LTRDDPDYAQHYAELVASCMQKGLALKRTWVCSACSAATKVDCVEILLLAIEPPCSGCNKPLPWRRTVDA